MDKDIIKEIFLLIFEVIKALCEILWKMVKGGIGLIWDRFFGMSDVSHRDEATEQEWGVTGEDKWPDASELQVTSPIAAEMPKQAVEIKETPYMPEIPLLPDNYGDNRIVLMVRDPAWLFSYWELQKDVMDGALNALGAMAHDAKLILRVYDVTDVVFDGTNAHKYFDIIEVTGAARKWYIHVGEPDRSFCVDIGFLAPDGTFRALARSNTVRTPRMGVSDVVDEKWMSIEELYEKVYRPAGWIGGESVFERVYKNWQEALREGVSSPH